jgi:hypothetical protein
MVCFSQLVNRRREKRRLPLVHRKALEQSHRIFGRPYSRAFAEFSDQPLIAPVLTFEGRPEKDDGSTVPRFSPSSQPAACRARRPQSADNRGWPEDFPAIPPLEYLTRV